MRERRTARVLLLDPEGRILLMRGRLPGDPAAPSVWFTVGGGMEPGESVVEAAAREIVEETGLTDARLGPIVWTSEAMLHDRKRRPVHFRESYVVAYTAGGDLSRAGWQPLEREFVDDVRWWTLGELQLTGEPVYPEGLAALLPEVLAGRFAAEPLVIRTLDGPVSPAPKAP
ncbi:MAG TPA: NUDIX domain-containing protein [Caulobacteraceae bacterium]